MNKILFLLIVPSFCLCQLDRSEVLAKLNEHEEYEIEKIQEINSLTIVTNNLYEENMLLINSGIAPIQETTYFFWDTSQNSKLKSVTTIYSSKSRYVVSVYSNEREPAREDFVGYIFSEVRTITRGPVEYNPETGMYFTREVSFNLE